MPGGLLRQSLVGAGLLILSLTAIAVADDVLVTVNGRPITQADLQLEAILRRVPADEIDEHRDELLDELIDQQLIAGFVARRRARANPIELESQVERIHALIHRRGETPQNLFERLGIDEQHLRERLGQSLAWTAYVQQVTTDQQLLDYFRQHRREFDGTQLRAQHILIQAAPADEAARNAARMQLAELRTRIVAGEVTFEAAAREHSQSPSAAQGGDVGYFGYRGLMPAPFADAAFALEVGQVSEPVATPFGVHLIKVTDERPGQLSLEDVRGPLLERLAGELRSAQIARDRPRAKIVRKQNGSE